MFADVRQMQELYNWADQEKEDWEKFHSQMAGGFCSGRHRHCHWGAFNHYWDDHFWGDSLGKICNDIDETGCNGPPFGDDGMYW
mmetsp:Transcript_50750/g.119359  ORF Transcript_50750/g.119359 Transcript_50750/m.119359 type:complete len:84 (+) Transcript_50750:176-427(+)